MAESIDLLDCLNAAQPMHATVGWRAGVPIRRDQFLDSVHAWQHLLAATPGKNFALYFGDSIEFAAALFGAWQAGKTIYLPADTLPATCTALRPMIDGYVGEFPLEYAPLNVTPISDAPGEWSFKALDPQCVGLVVHTSGSTGAAQAISKRLVQLAAEVATLEALFGERLKTADIVATVSHQHIYGLLFKVLWPLTAARSIHALSIAYPEELAAELAQRECVFVSSPAHLKRLPNTAIWAKAASQLRAVFSSGGPLPLEVAHTTGKLLGQVPVEVYGSSETGGIAWRQRDDSSDESWQALPGVAWRITPEAGLLEVHSKHLPDANWFGLSDRALAVPDGRFLLQGRVDRIVKIEEKRISLDTIEQQLRASGLVDDARVLVTDGAQQRQRVAAFIVLSRQGHASLQEIGKLAMNRLLRERLSDFVEPVALPRSWRYLDALPLNEQGKTTQAALMALLDDRVSRPTLPHARLIEQAGQRVVYELTAPKDLLYFEGHFPIVPILAGVVQIDWAIAFARQHFDVPAVFRSIHALKFQRVIEPEESVALELVYEPKKSSLTFTYSSPAGQHAGGRIQFGASNV